MKTLQDLKLHPKTKAKVTAWMKEWLNMLIKNTDGRQGNVYRADFENKDFFYFTDCRDIVSKETESTSDETNIKIRARKRYIMNQLLVKAMLGELKLNKLKCSHCGCENVYIDSIEGGFFKWCPKCLKTDISVFPDAYNTCIASMQMRLRKKYLGDDLADEEEKPKLPKTPPLGTVPNMFKKKKCEHCGKSLTNWKSFGKLFCMNPKCNCCGLAV